ncbi:unnamed protein product [Orchesella dallaii]|uniref:Tuberin-type domain-containing protein n=1 Tax=Orchesella dallaii TaxID=48710 RepID=A0ABP1RVS1_9HEXA
MKKPHTIIEGYSCYLSVDHTQPSLREHEAAATSFHWGSSSGGSNTGSGSGVFPPIQQPDKSSTPYVSYTTACKQVSCCLKKERDWKILELVLLQLPHVMENKAFHLSYVFPALTSLVSYHSSLGSAIQQQIVKCLEHGLLSKSSRICISALTSCTLEMKEVMHKLIPEILLSLSKFSPKLNIAVPVLEFPSSLIHLPRVFASFVQDQYMSICAICLPYTNPFKFNHYVVSLAHHVSALWFLKCRLSYRKAFVSYIIKGLESNVWAPFQEAERQLPQNEVSSNRKRSSSLTDNSNRRCFKM